MNKELYDAIKLSAEKARSWILQTIKKNTYSEKTHRAMNYNTGGWCAVATAKLYEILKQEKKLHGCEIIPVIAEHDYMGSHAFITLTVEDKKFIVDVTADQFGKAPIIIKSIDTKDNKLEWFWGGKPKFTNLYKGIKLFVDTVNEWEDQSPQRYGLLK